MIFKDRIKEFRRVPANEIAVNPKNHRTHPQAQREAIRGILEEVGFAGAELCYHSERANGALMLIDGELRRNELGDAQVPCLITDLNDDEADKLIAVFDPLAAMAETDAAKLDSLLRTVQMQSQPLADMLTRMAENAGIVPSDDDGKLGDSADDEIPAVYQVVVECRDEADQKKIFDQMKKDGRKCRLLSV